MGAVFQHIGTKIQPLKGTRILKADEYASLLKAQDILDAAAAEAKRIHEQAEERYKEREKEGYDDGVMEGRLEQSEKMLETGMQAVQYLEGLEHQIVELVINAVRKVIGELDSNDRIVRIVRTALDQVRGTQKVTIRVSPEEEPFVREKLAPVLSQPLTQSGIDLVADPRMKTGNCVLESEMGVVDASLDVQLMAIERALNAKIGEKS